MERHRCKLCHRRFANGRALGGHMRSHVVPSGGHLPSPSASSSSFPAMADAKSTDNLDENPTKSCSLADFEFSSTPAGSSSIVQDGCESDAESSFHRRPTKRCRRLSGVSSASEDVARCLMLLSRDAWSKSNTEEYQYHQVNDNDDDDDDQIVARSSQNRRKNFRCEACRKVFRSYQALGGHRASHKRVGIECVPVAGVKIAGGNASVAVAKIYECPYCDREFSSGQALGGHKRSHFAASAAVGVAEAAVNARFVVTSKSSSGRGIDLNLPAPLEEEPELSALSFTAEFAPK